MKKVIVWLFSFFLIVVATHNAHAACTDATPSGTVGAVPGTGGTGPLGYITDIVANGTSALSVTYTANGTGTKTTGTISFGNNSGITATGSWHGSRITQLNAIDNGDGTSTLSVNTNPSFRIVGARVSGSRTWNGVNGGVGKIEGLGGLATGFNVYGWDGVTNNVQQMGLTVIGTCTVTATAVVVGNTISMTAIASLEATSVDFYLGNPGSVFASDNSVPYTGTTGALASGRYTVYAVAHFPAGDVKSAIITT